MDHRKDFEAWAKTLPYNPNMERVGDNYKSAITQSLWKGFIAGREFSSERD